MDMGHEGGWHGEHEALHQHAWAGLQLKPISVTMGKPKAPNSITAHFSTWASPSDEASYRQPDERRGGRWVGKATRPSRALKRAPPVKTAGTMTNGWERRWPWELVTSKVRRASASLTRRTQQRGGGRGGRRLKMMTGVLGDEAQDPHLGWLNGADSQRRGGGDGKLQVDAILH